MAGTVEIKVQIDEPTQLIWMHAADMEVTRAEVLPDGMEAVGATLTQEDETGVAALRTEQPVGPGEAIIVIRYTAPFDRELKGLYRVDQGDYHYAFTQFEATSARYAFPCFDEPRFKTPFETTLNVPLGEVAVSNTQPVSERDLDERRQYRFARTEKLPTYLVAMAVGPLDIVNAPPLPPNEVRSRPLPFRGIAARGRGNELAYALEHTGPLLDELERYFGTEYPYDKLDIIAVPDFASGAMENAGAITFREVLLLLDPESAPESQRRAFAGVMAHELAHQWFGNLVTMPWWDDIWLNEAFATWMGYRTVAAVHPEYQADIALQQRVLDAMRVDSLVSARQIRQPVDTNHDIRNAFDGITYRKGGGVLGMFESYLGDETFRDGIRAYMDEHRWGNATADDLLRALTETAGRDVATPFRTFLMQPGVPYLDAETSCEGDAAQARFRQSRYFPVGSAGERERTWQVPVCVRYGRGTGRRAESDTVCGLVTEAEGSIDLPYCPDWMLPNAGGAGYYRFGLPASEVEALLRRGYDQLEPRERLSLADSLNAGFDAGTLDAAAVYAALPTLAADDNRLVATTPMRLVSFARDHLVEEGQRARVEAFAERLYRDRARRLGWQVRRGEDGETGLLRASIQSFLANTAQSTAARRAAVQRGTDYFPHTNFFHPEAVAGDLAGLALSVAIQEQGEGLWYRVLGAFRNTEDALLRSRALSALASTHDPELAQRSLELAGDPGLRVNEVTIPIRQQLAMPETRDSAWAYFQEHFDEIFDRVATTRKGYAPFFVGGFCSAERADEVEAFFTPRVAELPGGPRNMRSTVEAIRLCGARVEAQRESAQEFFSR